MLASIVFQQEGVGHVVLIGDAVRCLQPEQKVREMRYNWPGARAEPEGQVFKVVHLEQGHRGGRCVALRIDEGVGEGYTSHIVGMFDSKFQPNRTFRRKDRHVFRGLSTNNSSLPAISCKTRCTGPKSIASTVSFTRAAHIKFH